MHEFPAFFWNARRLATDRPEDLEFKHFASLISSPAACFHTHSHSFVLTSCHHDAIDDDDDKSECLTTKHGFGKE
eukprot:scaffold20763_cov32-Attheya_sp.AAC.2